MTETQWMSLIAGLLVLLLVWRGMRVMPREGMMRNVVIVLLTFVVLGLFYNAFGPFENFERRFQPPAESPPPLESPVDGGTRT